jgi:hypothetical protein
MSWIDPKNTVQKIVNFCPDTKMETPVHLLIGKLDHVATILTGRKRSEIRRNAVLGL